MIIMFFSYDCNMILYRFSLYGFDDIHHVNWAYGYDISVANFFVTENSPSTSHDNCIIMKLIS